MLELYQFELSHYSEKVRLILDYKQLEYRKIEVTPGVGQIELMQKSGSRQVPVLKDGSTYVADSTDIALYLERKYPEHPILPTNSLAKGQCLLMEEWADASLGAKGRKAFIGALNQNQNFRTSLLPANTPDLVKTAVGAIPGAVLDVLGTGVGFGGDAVRAAQKSLTQDLEALCLILQNQPYLTGDTVTLADLAVAGLSIYLKFPAGSYLDIPDPLKGKGIPGLADNITFEPFFAWRDRLYTDFRKGSSNPPATGNNSPTSISID
jgi:glutathione S-transferase